MASMNRIRVTWSGWPGQPGVSTFYVADSVMDVTPIKNFFTALTSFVVSGVQWNIPALGDKIADADGSLAGSWVGTGGGTVTANGGSTAYAGSAGFCVDWLTGTVVNRRRIQGRTFFVPAASSTYQTDGSIIETARTSIQTAASALISALTPNLLCWSRPVAGEAVTTGARPHPAVAPREGRSGPVLAARVPDIAAVLRSRRV